MDELKRLLDDAAEHPDSDPTSVSIAGLGTATVPLAALRRLVAIEGAAVRVREHERDKYLCRGPRFDGLIAALCEEVDRG